MFHTDFYPGVNMDDEIFTVFQGTKRLDSGTRSELEARLAPLGPHPDQLAVFSDETGRETDLNLSGIETPPPRGRPKLGVRAREVTLLPRHWDWLSRQSGGASATLRRLVDEARKRDTEDSVLRADRTFRFLTALAGDLPRFEEAIRALYAGDTAGFSEAMEGWPGDIRAHAHRLAGTP